VSADVVEAAAAVGFRVCVFRLGDEVFAFDIGRVREVVVLDELTPVPAAPPQVIGVANLRGDVLPVVGLERVLGLAPRRAARRLRTLVIAAGGAQVGLVIDDVLGLETYDEVADVEAATSERSSGCALGVMRRGEAVVTLLDAERIVAALRRREG